MTFLLTFFIFNLNKYNINLILFKPMIEMFQLVKRDIDFIHLIIKIFLNFLFIKKINYLLYTN